MINRDAIRAYCDDIDRTTQAIRDELAAPTPPDPRPPFEPVIVSEDDDLAAALAQGGAIVLAEGALFEGGATVAVPRTAILGSGGNTFLAQGRAAVTVPIGLADVILANLIVEADYPVAVLLGRNDSQQTTVEQAPSGIRIRGVASLAHRGKRAFEVNAADVTFVGCEVRDCYDPGGQDSQAIWIGNAPGPVTADGCYLEAASETIMVGGDAMKIPNCRPTGITVRRCTLTKPIAWKSAGTPKVKNLFELKDGHDVLVDDCELFNSWKSAQDGYAFMFTPTRGGSLRNVVVNNCRVWAVGGIVNITGIDDELANAPRTQVTIRGGEYRTDPAMGGQGRFALVGRGPESFVVENVFAEVTGSAFIDFSDSAHVDLFRLVGSTWNYPTYGIRIAGANHGDNSHGVIGTIQIEGNTIRGAHSTFRDRYPNNVYV